MPDVDRCVTYPDQVKRSALTYALSFFFTNAPAVLSLCFIAAVGRVAQIGWGGHLSGIVATSLEFLVESTRVVLVLLVLGNGSVRQSIAAIRRLFTLPKDQKDYVFSHWWRNARDHWPTLLRDLVLFGILAVVINLLIGVAAESQSVHALLRGLGIPNADRASLQNVATLFIKNLTVIPLTIVFEFGLIRYVWCLRLSAEDVRAETGRTN